MGSITSLHPGGFELTRIGSPILRLRVARVGFVPCRGIKVKNSGIRRSGMTITQGRVVMVVTVSVIVSAFIRLSFLPREVMQ